MPRELWFDRLGEALTRTDKVRYAAPVSATADAAAEVSFRGFGPYATGGAPAWSFSTGLRVEMPQASKARSLYAMTTGAMRYKPGTSAGRGTVILKRGD